MTWVITKSFKDLIIKINSFWNNIIVSFIQYLYIKYSTKFTNTFSSIYVHQCFPFRSSRNGKQFQIHFSSFSFSFLWRNNYMAILSHNNLFLFFRNPDHVPGFLHSVRKIVFSSIVLSICSWKKRKWHYRFFCGFFVKFSITFSCRKCINTYFNILLQKFGSCFPSSLLVTRPVYRWL